MSITTATPDGASAATAVDVWELDLGSYASVRAFASRAEQELDRLDVLVDNASIAASSRDEAEGHELTITVNVLSTFLLTLLLLPKLRLTASRWNVLPHIVVVSSGGASWVGSRLQIPSVSQSRGSRLLFTN